MNYDTIILEMLSRIQALEQELKKIKGDSETTFASEKILVQEAKGRTKIGTKEIRDYIGELKEQAIAAGENSLVLISGKIHKDLKLKNRIPLVCNAMKQSMGEKDEIIHSTPSGYSSTIKIKYYLKEE